jgi:hypothetical protein
MVKQQANYLPGSIIEGANYVTTLFRQALRKKEVKVLLSLL